MSDTPRTDAVMARVIEERGCDGLIVTTVGRQTAFCVIDEMRKMERELTEARKILDLMVQAALSARGGLCAAAIKDGTVEMLDHAIDAAREAGKGGAS